MTTKTKTFDFLSDPGHGWLKVPYELLERLGIQEYITRFSYRREDWCYLEEDQDASAFIRAWERLYEGRKVRLRERTAEIRASRVRSYPGYYTD